MTLALPEISSLEELDFEIPCENYKHLHKGDESASWRLIIKCYGCDKKVDFLVCDPCKKIFTDAQVLECLKCKSQFPPDKAIILMQYIK